MDQHPQAIISSLASKPIHKFVADQAWEQESESKYKVDPEINSKISLFEGDITSLQIDGIVSSNSSNLKSSGGIRFFSGLYFVISHLLLRIKNRTFAAQKDECRALNLNRIMLWYNRKSNCSIDTRIRHIVHHLTPPSLSSMEPSYMHTCFKHCNNFAVARNRRLGSMCLRELASDDSSSYLSNVRLLMKLLLLMTLHHLRLSRQKFC